MANIKRIRVNGSYSYDEMSAERREDTGRASLVVFGKPFGAIRLFIP
jgi:hypothetical protein